MLACWVRLLIDRCSVTKAKDPTPTLAQIYDIHIPLNLHNLCYESNRMINEFIFFVIT